VHLRSNWRGVEMELSSSLLWLVFLVVMKFWRFEKLMKSITYLLGILLFEFIKLDFYHFHTAGLVQGLSR
jgi:hypothetical protein